MRLQIRRLMASAVWLSLGAGLSVVTTNDAYTLANAIISGPGITLLGGVYSGAPGASGTFTGGFYNIKSGVILTSGEAVGATGGSRNMDNGQPGYPGISSVNAAVLGFNFRIEAGYNGFELEFVFAAEDIPDFALDGFGVHIEGGSFTTFDISHPFMAKPPATSPPNPLPYRATSPPLLMGFSTGAGVFDVDLFVYNYDCGYNHDHGHNYRYNYNCRHNNSRHNNDYRHSCNHIYNYNHGHNYSDRYNNNYDCRYSYGHGHNDSYSYRLDYHQGPDYKQRLDKHHPYNHNH
ncbi:hypothetical protein CEP52_000657 [Fusarium oligoseptatum]|uniref:Uncharacterized protein n=1 Tax=Fusarium oligoseptatum TaxID=2604345 RepID=A0A428UMT8_9HYPO|nr:hypothetical protein CEP52_000657 [Fusarium oligoseptatum]